MKFEMIPGTMMAGTGETLQPLLFLVAVPLVASLIFGVRKEPAVLAALLLGSVAVMVR